MHPGFVFAGKLLCLESEKHECQCYHGLRQRRQESAAMLLKKHALIKENPKHSRYTIKPLQNPSGLLPTTNRVVKPYLKLQGISVYLSKGQKNLLISMLSIS